MEKPIKDEARNGLDIRIQQSIIFLQSNGYKCLKTKKIDKYGLKLLKMGEEKVFSMNQYEPSAIRSAANMIQVRSRNRFQFKTRTETGKLFVKRVNRPDADKLQGDTEQ
jgi:hypothetical protein